MSIAYRVAIRKQANPAMYCPAPRCLWRTGGGYCPRHAPAHPSPAKEARK